MLHNINPMPENLDDLPPETRVLLDQVAAMRGQEPRDCLHNVLAEEVRRSAPAMKAKIDRLADLPLAPKDQTVFILVIDG